VQSWRVSAGFPLYHMNRHKQQTRVGPERKKLQP
jgi:hypothetical protein